MGIIKEIFCGGVTRDDMRADFVKARPQRKLAVPTEAEKTFNPSQHRGQPGNAGQFGPGGGSAPAHQPAQAAAKPEPHQIAETAAHRVADKIAAGKPISSTDRTAIANSLQHLDRKQLDGVIAKLGLPPIPSHAGGRTTAILGAVAAHASNVPASAPLVGGHIDLKTAKPIDYSGETASQIPGWEGMSEVPPNMQSYGAVLMRTDPQTGKPQVMLREPTGHYGGYAWTWPQGRPNDANDKPATAAHREVGEETGLSGEIIGHIPQTFSQVFRHGDHVENAYFIMRHDGGDVDFRKLDAETNDAQWVDLDQAHTLIAHSTNQAGRERDLKVLDAARQMVGVPSGTAKTKSFDESKVHRDHGKFSHTQGASDEHDDDSSSKPSAASGVSDHPHIHTPQFKAWFGDWENDPANASKVVDADGVPQETHGTAKKVFHGTHADFDLFDKEKARGANAGKGFYFAEDRVIAETFSDWGGDDDDVPGRIIEAYLNIRNPFSFEGTVSHEEMARFLEIAKKVCPDAFDLSSAFGKYAEEDFARRTKEKSGGGALAGYDAWNILRQAVDSDKVNDVLQSAGYDGIVHGSKDEAGTPAKPGEKAHTGRCWIAFEPTQIKSVDNQGTFDPHDPNMKKAVGRLVEKGFTGTVTASNGVVYHYVDGKRVAGPQQYNAHLQAHPHLVPRPD